MVDRLNPADRPPIHRLRKYYGTSMAILVVDGQGLLALKNITYDNCGSKRLANVHPKS
jgi:hypothetical protein